MATIRNDKIFELQRTLMTDVYPEMVRIMKLIGENEVAIHTANLYKRKLIVSGDINTEDGATTYAINGNVFRDDDCPTYKKLVYDNCLNRYHDYAKATLEVADYLKKKLIELENTISRASNFPLYRTRKVIIEKIS